MATRYRFVDSQYPHLSPSPLSFRIGRLKQAEVILTMIEIAE